MYVPSFRSDRPIVPQREIPRAGNHQEEFLRIYVGNLQHEFTEGDVREMFTTHGQVDSVAIILNRDTHRSKGFAFIEMPSSVQAKAAIKALDGQIFHQPSRTLTVTEARPRQEGAVTVNGDRLRPERSFAGGGGFGNRDGGRFVSRNSPRSGGPSVRGPGTSGGGRGGSRSRRGGRGSR